MIKAKPLISEDFAPFGQVLTGHGRGPERLAYAARMENRRAHAKPNMTFMRIKPVKTPVRIKAFERHCYSNQTFIPLNGIRHLIVVCPSTVSGAPDISKLIAFTAEGSQAVNYNAGVWHAPRSPLEEPGEFIMFRWDDGSDDDMELFPMATEIEVDIGDEI